MKIFGKNNMVKLIFNNETEEGIDDAIFSALLKKACNILDKQSGEIGLIMVNNARIQMLNRDYRKKDAPTDVLSFEYGESDLIGDIFISIETALKQAEEKGHSLEKELSILFTHGMLHVFGFDHKNDEEESKMEEVAGDILKHIV